ncbi:MAG: phospho-N-acetylmuramoyl-pentapeptide-transferase [Firmicutes bacterium]|nr:phospho-N-acetylmuramoyl-pentapeptide-transferase [Bacillota bacterium]
MILIKSSLVLLSSFILSLILGYLLIPFLKKKANQRLSEYLKDAHRSKEKVPTMGGIIFILPVIIVMLLLIIFNKIQINYSIIIILFTFISYSIIGFIDDYLIIKRNNNRGLSEKQKFLMQLFVAIIFFYLFMKSGNEPLLWIHTLGLKINLSWFYGLFILFVLTATSNAVNITDGLDGLAGGLSVIAFLTYAIISYNTGWLEGYESITLFCFTLIGSLLGFLVFNSNPAKIFMGDTGSLCLGATLGGIAILTRYEIFLILIGIVFVIETLSCIIQRTYYKFTKKRIFLMTPIHHTFEKKGWIEKDIVKLFWIIGLIFSLISISFIL